MKTGLRGWNEYEQPLVDRHGQPVELAASGRHAEAVKALEEASSEIYKLFRIAGFYVPD